MDVVEHQQRTRGRAVQHQLHLRQHELRGVNRVDERKIDAGIVARQHADVVLERAPGQGEAVADARQVAGGDVRPHPVGLEGVEVPMPIVGEAG